jgi:sugar phosphate isomerase/epimerase
MVKLPFRLGTTSYILPDDILPNVRWLAGRVQDVELVLFEVDDGFNNLPAPEVVAELAAIAQDSGLSYTVHLPLDLTFRRGDPSLEKAERVMRATLALEPWAYVAHLDGRGARGADAAGQREWSEQAVRALELAGEWAGGIERVCIENLEGYPPDFLDAVLAGCGVSRCVDVGHLWLEGHDAVSFLERALARTRVVHLHGVHGRDHQSLAHVPAQALDGVLGLLARRGFAGVTTMEVFHDRNLEGDEDNFASSLAAVNASLERITREGNGRL